MNHPDGELPENWQGKAKDDAALGSIRRLWLAVALLILLLGIGVAVGILRPDLLGALFPNAGQTQTAEALHILQTQQALQATAQANAQRGTQGALDLQGTQSALNATQAALNQAGTQSAIDAIAARTATVQAIRQQATLDALELQGTQAALNLAGTQAGLDVQSTLAELQGSNPTQVIEDQALATPTPTMRASAASIDDDFSEGISPGVWNFGIDDWTVQAAGLRANAENSRLLTQRTDFTDYTLEVWFTPPNRESDIYLYHSVSGGTSWAVGLDYNGTAVNRVALSSGVNTPLETLRATSAQVIDAETFQVRLQISATQLTVTVNNQLLIDTPLTAVAPGAVGVVLPLGATLERVVITTN